MAPGLVLAIVLASKGQTTQRQGSFTRSTRMYGTGFNVAQSAFSTLASVLCAVLSVLAITIGKRRRAALNLPTNDSFLTTQRKMEKTVFAIVVTSVLLVALPTSFRILLTLNLEIAEFEFGDAALDSLLVVRRYCVILLIANSALNFWLYIVFNSQFRRQAMRYILGKTGPEVGAMSGATIASNMTRARLFTKRVDIANAQIRMEDCDR